MTFLSGLSWGRRPILRMTMRRMRWYPFHHTSCGSGGPLYNEGTGLRLSLRDLDTRTRLSLMPKLNLRVNLSLKTTSFHSVAVQFLPVRHHSKTEMTMSGCQWQYS
ncbi:hypothetical protein TNCV_963701 [Trichonephila clavipes]|nr:hypothetical protein TNCV_963701 [Trichonephila clavipes]